MVLHSISSEATRRSLTCDLPPSIHCLADDTMSSVKYTLQEPKRPDVVGSDAQVFDRDDYVKFIVNGINARTIKALGSVNMNGDLHYLVMPRVHTDLDQDPVGIVGNMSNIQGEFTIAYVSMTSIGGYFCSIDKRNKLILSQAAPDNILEKYLKDEAGTLLDSWKDDTADLGAVTLPAWFPIYAGQDLPRGRITKDRAIDAMKALGPGYEKWALAAKRSFECNLDIEVVVETITKAGPDTVKKYLCDRPVTRRIATNGPVTVRNQVDSEEYPQEAKEIRKFFLPGMADPSRPSRGQVVDYVSAADREKEAETRRNEAHLALKHIHCKIDFEKVEITNLAYPTYSSSMKEVLETPRSSRNTPKVLDPPTRMICPCSL